MQLKVVSGVSEAGLTVTKKHLLNGHICFFYVQRKHKAGTAQCIEFLLLLLQRKFSVKAAIVDTEPLHVCVCCVLLKVCVSEVFRWEEDVEVLTLQCMLFFVSSCYDYMIY